MNLDINFLEYSKAEIKDKGATKAIEITEEGREDCLKAYVWAKAAIEYLNAFINEMHDAAMYEFDQYGEKEVDLFGHKISKGEVGTKYNYKDCGHIYLPVFEGNVKLEKEKLDNLMKEIKALREPKTYVDEDTGETFRVVPPTKTSTTKLKITL